MTRCALIMAGGSGERFWPLSRRLRPKQFLPFGAEGRSMLGDAVDRVAPLLGVENVLVATIPPLADSVRELLPELAPGQVFAEPHKRNTAGALVWAAANLEAQHGSRSEISMAVLTSDHHIGPPEAFRLAVAAALDLCESEKAITIIGVQPDRPDTGFGYVEAKDGEVYEYRGQRVRKVAGFREKPSVELAEDYLARGDFFWNSGMFFWTLEVFAEELRVASPMHLMVWERLVPLLEAGDHEAAARVFAELPDISIDYALMEHTTHVLMVESAFEWDDLGTWDSLRRHLPQDARSNAVQGSATLVNASDCVVYNASGTARVCVSSVSNLVIVATDSAILVCDRRDPQSVRALVATLGKQGIHELL
jgi:mannose-1-phosphate guanylyltransferase